MYIKLSFGFFQIILLFIKMCKDRDDEKDGDDVFMDIIK